MIEPERFIARSSDRPAWLAARAGGITATAVAKASTPQGFTEVLNELLSPSEQPDNDYMKFGRDNESWIAMWIKGQYGILPNDWLIASKDVPQFLSTPDGLSLDHKRIAEIKTGGTEPKSPPIGHRRQVSWQFRTTDAESAIYAFMLRTLVNGVYVPAWLEPKVWVIERDETMIAQLELTANLLLDEVERSVA